MEMLFENSSSVFFVDAMLGNIAKKLRIMGFDCMYDANIDKCFDCADSHFLPKTFARQNNRN